MEKLVRKVLTKQKQEPNDTAPKVEIYSKNLYLIGDIDNIMSEKIITNLLEDDKINTIKTINLFISSAGGCLHDCMAMMDLIDFQREVAGYKVNTFGLGEVCSGGFFMFLMGDERILFPKCRVFVHEHMIVGDEDEPYSKKIENMHEDRVLNKIYVQFVADKLGISYKSAKTLLKKDKWLSDKEIEQYNIVTGTIDGC
jgi:ATP-dependent protease ClpP protease subunit